MSLDAERAYWLAKGMQRVYRWCKLNRIEPPKIHTPPGKSRVSACAYYRDGHITIYPESCARLGRGGLAWSWPGYVVDRTPFGVLAHELGHHVDQTKYVGAVPYGGVAHKIKRESGEPAITTYAPDDTEWFAEMFRLFVTNPRLLKAIRPQTYEYLSNHYVSVEGRGWRTILSDSPRHIAAAQNKIHAARRLHARI